MRWMTSRALYVRPKTKEICVRSILIKAIVEVWGEGATNEELNASIAAFPEEQRLPYLAEGTTFKAGPGRYRSTRHKIPFKSRYEGST